MIDRAPRRRVVPGHPGIYFRPSGNDSRPAPPYEFNYWDSSGKRRWVTVRDSLKEAEAQRAAIRMKLRRGGRVEPSSETFEAHAERWLARQAVRPRTLENYRWALTNHLNPFFGRLRLQDITVDHIASFIAELRTSKQLKGSTVETSLRPLRVILRQAVRHGHIQSNPYNLLERHERPRLDDKRPQRVLARSEIDAIIQAADSDAYRCLIALLIFAGLRLSEALGLTVGDLEPKRALVFVRYQLGRDGVRALPKTSTSRRTVAIPPQLMQEIVQLVTQRGDRFRTECFVFATRSGTGIQQKTVRAALTRAARTAGIAEPFPTPHSLRHTHASMLIGLNHTVIDVQRRVGHSNPATTLRIYAHQWADHEASQSMIGQQLNAIYLGNDQPRAAGGAE